jgi:DNA-binding GntR family transcriptional regulator
MKSSHLPKEISGNRAYQAIKEMVFNYQVVPGQKITYNQLAEKLRMSKTPIINALNRLEQEEFVVSLPNRGYFIKEINVEEVAEMFKIREALEMLVVEESIRKQTPQMLIEVEKAMVAHRQYHYDIMTRKRLALDAAFHLKIAEMAGSRNLVRLLKHVFEHIYLRHRSEGISPQRLVESAKEHQKLLLAIKQRKLTEAKRLMKQHVQAGRAATIRGIERASEDLKF